MVAGTEAKNDDDYVILIVRKICTDLELTTEFEEFAEANIEPFLSYDDDEGKGEQSHDVYEVYLKYLDHFEQRIEREIVKHSIDVPSFYKQARHVLDTSEHTNSNRFFIEALLSTTEYSTFLSLMKNEAHRFKSLRDQSRRKK